VIDLDALAANLRWVRRVVAGRRILAVVKADAYGHGLLPVARRLALEGVDGFCVALAEEGLALREAGIDLPVLVLNGIYGDAHGAVLAAGLTPVVYDPRDVDAFAEAAGDGVAEVHLALDTGLHRLGVLPAELGAMLDRLDERPTVRVSGVMTHFASAESDPGETAAQLARFDAGLETLRSRGHAPRTLHAANSAGALFEARSRLDLVRAGLVLFGVGPGPGLPLVPAMTVVTTVVRSAVVPAGGRVGYGGTFTAPSDRRVATLAMGYGDGYPWRLSGRGEVLIRGVRCPIVGRVSMDLTGVDVSDLPFEVDRGEEAVVLGIQGDEWIRAEELAAWSDTLAYEVLCRISPRVPRVYRGVRGPEGEGVRLGDV
jgi:alanine racemase